MSNPTPDDAGWLLDEYDAERFWSRVNFRGGREYEGDPLASATGDCWTWRGIPSEAYAHFKIHGVQQAAHRIALRDFGRKIPDGFVVDHLCRVHSCVNPAHLEAVPFQENLRRGKRGLKAKCPNGHAYSAENTKIVKRNGRNVRYCGICLKASKSRTYLRRKAA